MIMFIWYTTVNKLSFHQNLSPHEIGPCFIFFRSAHCDIGTIVKCVENTLFTTVLQYKKLVK